MAATIFKFLLVLALIALGSFQAWEAMGNMTDYVEGVRGYIDIALAKVKVSKVYMNGATYVLANSLNAKWDSYWNTAIFQKIDTNPALNAVVYGYAFRDHWLWFNSYAGTKYSFIVWKDYNGNVTDSFCSMTTTYYINTNFDADTKAAIVALLVPANIAADVWAVAKSIVDTVQARRPGESYSIILYPGDSLLCFYFRAVSGYKILTGKDVGYTVVLYQTA